MTLLWPIGLLALLALPLIIVLHLLRERRRRVVVPSLLHWQNLPQRQTAQRSRRLPLTLLLLIQLLAAALIALALARPQLGNFFGSTRQLAIVLDTSTSMAAREGSGTRFAQAQSRARTALNSLGSGDRAILVAAGTTARVLATGTGADIPALLATLDTVQPGGTGTDFTGAFTLAQAAFAGQARREILVLTDNGPSTTGLPASVAAALSWQQIGTAQPNRAIVVLAARAWGAQVQVYARLANYAPTPFSARIALYADERTLGERTANIAANGETELTWTLPASYATLRAVLDGGDSLPQDDEARLSLAQTRPLAIELVSAAPAALRRALAAVPSTQVTVTAPAAYQPGSQAALTVFDNFLPAAWPAGPVLVINPPIGSTLLSVREGTTPAKASPLDTRGALLAGLSLAGVDFGPLRSIDAPAGFTAQLANGETPLILRGRSDTHDMAIWAFDPSAGNFTTRLAFPLLIARTVRDLTPAPLPQSVLAGTPLVLRPDARATALRIAGPAGETSTLPATPLLTLDQLTQPGIYAIEEQANGATLFRSQLPVNAGAALEANLYPQPTPTIAEASPSSNAPAAQQLRDTWHWFALGALALLLLEWGYIHR